MAPRAIDPLENTRRVIVDGTNVLHALARGGAAGPLPAAALIGRIRALVPAAVSITIVLDGPPAPGAHERRVTSGVEVRHANCRSADDVIRDLTGAPADGILVVTDDRALRTAVTFAGARTASSLWLSSRLSRQQVGSTGPAGGKATGPRLTGPKPASIAPAKPHLAAGGPKPEADADGRRWAPGRGATKKTGNAKRGRPPA